MAQQFLSLNRGQEHTGDVAVATSAPSADIYVQILTTNSPTKLDVIKALYVIIRYLIGNGVPGGKVGVDMPVL